MDARSFAHPAVLLGYMPVRIVLIVVTLVLSLTLGSMAIAGLRFGLIPIGVAGLCGLLGAWARLLVSAARLRAHPVLRVAIAALLLVGVALAAFILVGTVGRPPQSPGEAEFRRYMAAFIGTALVVGLWCLAATIFIRDGEPS
jgi:hypothetical protein